MRWLTVPAAVLAAAYLWLAWDHGTLLLWDVVVHEGGRHTLGATTLYFDHFLREVPVDLAMALFLAAELSGRPGERAPAVLRASGGAAALLAAALVALAAVVAVARHGAGSAALDLLQYRVRDDAPPLAGSHWNYHLLSTLWIAFAARPLGRLAGGEPSVPLRWLAWGSFLAATAAFGVSAETFTSVRYVGHQAREAFTHALLTVPLALGLWRALAGVPPVGTAAAWRPGPCGALCLAAVGAISAHFAVVVLSGDVMAAGQSALGLPAMVGAHFWEHVLDAALVALVVVAVAASPVAGRAAVPAPPVLDPST